MLLQKIEIANHPIFKEMELYLEHKQIDGNTYTVIIGSNGAGKSNLLRVITEVFIDLKKTQDNQKKSLKYKYEVSLWQNGEVKKVGKHAIGLPKKIIASAISLNDKFPILTSTDRKNNTFYKYLGSRTASNNIFLGKNKDIFFENLMNISRNKEKAKSLSEALMAVQIPSIFSISFKKGRYFKKVADSFYKNKSLEKFVSDLESTINESKKGKVIRFSDEKILSFLKKGEIAKLVSGMEYLSSNELQEFIIDLSNTDQQSGALDYFNVLLDLNIVDIKEILILGERTYSLDQASSGEFHLINSISSIISELDDDVLLLIDEPEISLHPNWQMKYLDFLRKAISNFSNVQVIIATHSHFILSSLESSNGIVVQAFRENNKVKFKQMEFEPEGMSPENILYNVFGVTSFYNHYFELDLRKMVNLIATESRNVAEIENILNRLKKFKIDPNDPLTKVLTQAQEYIVEHST